STEGEKRKKAYAKKAKEGSSGSRDRKRTAEGRKKGRVTESGTQGNASDLWTGKRPTQSPEGSKSPEKPGRGTSRAAKKMKALLRKSKEGTPSAGTPTDLATASNILDLMGTVPQGSEPPPAPTPLGFGQEAEGSGGYEEVGPGKDNPPPPPPPAAASGGMW
ncbi:hypothetical protein ANCDUO_12738, partial [Ancylostoma duodenale]